CLQALEFPFSF
nr:immunoglobulin light chain junction region [Macaca mulatta]MOX86588.1 immunoglobulin light chain junction region [Macaca mulatta]MOX87889.1 immunoglobulin light chain junction region [Macaca mulatta]MOX87902.1 immunoglobulin light chain junction region [Macaca mulatta]MOX88297.1 immunoglobulin light chain junction region [Macaca mulatta]